MNREQAKELLPIIQAFADGAEIQTSSRQSEWRDISEPAWSSLSAYRIKPKEQEPREFWVSDSGPNNPIRINKRQPFNSDYFKVREVIE